MHAYNNQTNYGINGIYIKKTLHFIQSCGSVSKCTKS
jgi:hypothetical protein